MHTSLFYVPKNVSLGSRAGHVPLHDNTAKSVPFHRDLQQSSRAAKGSRIATGVVAATLDCCGVPHWGISRAPAKEPLSPFHGPNDLPRVEAPGQDTQRILILGGGAAGFGVLTHELGLPGHLARQLRHLTGRGQIIDVVSDNKPTTRSIPSAIASQPLWRFDAVVIILASPHPMWSFLRPKWRADGIKLVEELDRNSSVGTSIVIAAPRPRRRPSGFLGTTAPGSRRRTLTDILTAQCAKSERVEYVELADDRDRTPQASLTYQAWAQVIASRLSARMALLPTHANRPLLGSAREKRDRPQVEHERQSALDSLRIVNEHPDAELRRMVDFLRKAYGTRYAALNVIDGDRQWTLAAAGARSYDRGRSESLCAVTIQHDAPMVIGDAREDLLFSQYSEVKNGAIRFYAGHPIESPDGLRLGALCICGPDPLEDEQFDPTVLKMLVRQIERRLWERASQ
jgi:hypothetical protein